MKRFQFKARWQVIFASVRFFIDSRAADGTSQPPGEGERERRGNKGIQALPSGNGGAAGVWELRRVGWEGRSVWKCANARCDGSRH